MLSALQTLIQELIQRLLVAKVSNEKYLSWLYFKLWEEEATSKKENNCHVSEFTEMVFGCVRKTLLEMVD